MFPEGTYAPLAGCTIVKDGVAILVDVVDGTVLEGLEVVGGFDVVDDGVVAVDVDVVELHPVSSINATIKIAMELKTAFLTKRLLIKY
jgi:hypothetical protein